MSLGKQAFNKPLTLLTITLTLNDFRFMLLKCLTLARRRQNAIVVVHLFWCTMNDKQTYSVIVTFDVFCLQIT